MDYIVKAYKDWKLHSQFQEIVPDMDDEYMFNEKQSIRDSARTLKKYGSTCCNQIRNNETLIRHEIEKTDTLQGIALKYGCTTEQIRRANRLFASDSLFLRQYLLVPVEKSSPYYPAIIEEPNSMPSPIDYQHHAGTILQNSSSNNATTTTHTGAAPIATATTIHNHRTLPTVNSENCLNDNPRFNNDLPARPYSIAGEMSLQTNHENNLENLNNHYTGGGSCSSGVGTSSAASSSKQSKSLDSVVTPMSPEEENRKCINEFLNKIDNTISESRKYVEKSKEMIASQSDDGIFTSTDFVQRTRRNNLNNSYKNNTRQNHQNHVRQSSTGSGSDTSYLLNTTQTRHLQSRLTHLEKQQDEFFEL